MALKSSVIGRYVDTRLPQFRRYLVPVYRKYLLETQRLHMVYFFGVYTLQKTASVVSLLFCGVFFRLFLVSSVLHGVWIEGSRHSSVHYQRYRGEHAGLGRSFVEFLRACEGCQYTSFQKYVIEQRKNM